MSIPGDSFKSCCHWVQDQPVAMVVFCHFVFTVKRVHRHGDGYDRDGSSHSRLSDCCEYSRRFLHCDLLLGAGATCSNGRILSFCIHGQVCAQTWRWL